MPSMAINALHKGTSGRAVKRCRNDMGHPIGNWYGYLARGAGFIWVEAERVSFSCALSVKCRHSSVNKRAEAGTGIMAQFLFAVLFDCSLSSIQPSLSLLSALAAGGVLVSEAVWKRFCRLTCSVSAGP